MICKYCGTEFSDDFRYCPGCGNSITGKHSGINIIQMKCKACNGEMEYNKEKHMLVCPYCDTTEMITESDEVLIERIKNDTYRDVEMAKLQHEKEKEKIRQEENKVNNFKKSIFGKIIFAFAIISAFSSLAFFAENNVEAGFVALIQAILFIVARLIGSRRIKTPNYKVYKVFAIIGFILIIPFSILVDNDGIHDKEMVWEEIMLGEKIPEPDSDKATVWTNSNDRLSIEIHNYKQSRYKNYVNDCKEYGYTIDAVEQGNTYKAYNEEGYSLEVSYYEYNNELNIRLDAPVLMNDISWPVSGMGKQLPQPKSLYGYVEQDSNNYYSVYIGNTTDTDYNNYVDLCINAGFNIDYNKYNDSFRGENSQGDKLSIEFLRFNIMKITVYNWDK